MKKLKVILLAGIMVAGMAAQASVTNVYTSPTQSGAVIPDNNGSGYSSTLTIGNDTGITSLSYLRINLNISGGFNGDLYAYLTHDGQTAILLNRIGTSGSGTYGSSQAGMNIWFNDTISAANVHTAGTLSSGGSYASDGRYASPYDLAAVQAAGSSTLYTLNNFAGQSAAGNWTLFIADVDGGGTSTLNSWQLEITQVPEPTNIALGLFASSFVVLQGVRLETQDDNHRKLTAAGGKKRFR